MSLPTVQRSGFGGNSSKWTLTVPSGFRFGTPPLMIGLPSIVTGDARELSQVERAVVHIRHCMKRRLARQGANYVFRCLPFSDGLLEVGKGLDVEQGCDVPKEERVEPDGVIGGQ